MISVSVVGAAALWDYIFSVNHLPNPGDIVKINKGSMQPYIGGCAPNIAAGLAKTGIVTPKLFYPVGKDFLTKDVKTIFQGQGINCDNVAITDASESPFALLFMKNDGTTMCFSKSSDEGFTTLLPVELDDIVVFCPVLNEYTKSILDQAIDRRKEIIFTGIASTGLIEYLDHIDVLIINGFEASQLSEKLNCKDIFTVSSKYSSTIIYVTQGRNGSQVFRAGKCTEVPIVKEEIRQDVTGAGDGFTTGVVAGMVLGKDAETCAYIGATVSSFIIEKFGGQTNLPTWDQIQARLSAQFPAYVNENTLPESKENNL